MVPRLNGRKYVKGGIEGVGEECEPTHSLNCVHLCLRPPLFAFSSKGSTGELSGSDWEREREWSVHETSACTKSSSVALSANLYSYWSGILRQPCSPLSKQVKSKHFGEKHTRFFSCNQFTTFFWRSSTHEDLVRALRLGAFVTSAVPCCPRPSSSCSPWSACTGAVGTRSRWGSGPPLPAAAP